MNRCTVVAYFYPYLIRRFSIIFRLQQDEELLANINLACIEVRNGSNTTLGMGSYRRRDIKYYSKNYDSTGSDKPLNLAIDGWLRDCLDRI